MKKKQFNRGSIVAAAAITAAIVCSIAWIRPSFNKGDKDKAPARPTPAIQSPDAPVSDEARLVQLLEADVLISQVKGFSVERKLDVLIVNGEQLPASVAAKYLSAVSTDQIWIRVSSFEERLRQHPNGDFLQLLLPVMLSSPCVKSKPKNGC